MNLGQRTSLLALANNSNRYRLPQYPYQHKCTLAEDHDDIPEGFWRRLRRKYYAAILISLENCYSLLFFRSRKAVRTERNRQLFGKHPYIIHPFSVFKIWYDVYIFFVYILAVVNKPTEGAFVDRFIFQAPPAYNYICFTTDMICFIDILINFFSGYIIQDLRKTELNPVKIAKHYSLGPFFICDLLSCIPKSLIYNTTMVSEYMCHFVDICCMLKIMRIISIYDLSKKILLHFGIRMNTLIEIMRATLISCTLIHYAACILYLVPRLMNNRTWQGSFSKTYVHYFFKSSAYVLSIRLDTEKFEPKYAEEYILAIFFYIVGKMIVAGIWVILVSIIRDSRSAAISYRAKMNQVEAYLKHRQTPPEVCAKIRQFYNFKFKNVHFKESTIEMLLSDHLKKEVKLVMNRGLLENIPLFSLLSMDEFIRIQSHLVYEILTPNTIVFHSGSIAHHMYFLASGTVAVYTHSGKEVDHLQDGAYFGEISLLLRNKRQVTVLTLEFCEVIKLSRSCFEKYLMKNKKIAKHLIYWAKIKFQEVAMTEQQYRFKNA